MSPVRRQYASMWQLHAPPTGLHTSPQHHETRSSHSFFFTLTSGECDRRIRTWCRAHASSQPCRTRPVSSFPISIKYVVKWYIFILILHLKDILQESVALKSSCNNSSFSQKSQSLNLNLTYIFVFRETNWSFFFYIATDVILLYGKDTSLSPQTICL